MYQRQEVIFALIIIMNKIEIEHLMSSAQFQSDLEETVIWMARRQVTTTGPANNWEFEHF